MGFEIGNTLGTGRVKGSKNKTTASVRKAMQTLLTDNIETFQNDLQSIEPVERLKILISLARLILPPLKQSLEIEQAEKPIFNISFKD